LGDPYVRTLVDVAEFAEVLEDLGGEDGLLGLPCPRS
jgi:hypothetical protein